MLIKGVDGEIEGDLGVTYTSPKAIDAEKDTIIMNFDGEDIFMRAKKNDEDAFYIKINKGLLPKKTANYSVSVRLEDSRGAKNELIETVTV